MKFGYIDESGTPGISTAKDDYLAITLIIFDDKSKSQFLAKYAAAQQAAHKPSDFEFHFAHNTTLTRAHFIEKFITCDFRYITIAIRKNGSRNFASYSRIANMLIDLIADMEEELRIDMDINPTLFKYLKISAKNRNLPIKIRQLKSHTCPMLQLADYVVALSLKHIKANQKYIAEYKRLSKKCLTLLVEK